MLEAFIDQDNKNTKLFGLVQVKKIYVPWIMMIIIQVAVPDASLVGHFTGIIAALLIKYSGVGFFFLPRYSWIKEFEDSYLVKRFTYYKASANQETDFRMFSLKRGGDPIS